MLRFWYIKLLKIPGKISGIVSGKNKFGPGPEIVILRFGGGRARSPIGPATQGYHRHIGPYILMELGLGLRELRYHTIYYRLLKGVWLLTHVYYMYKLTPPSSMRECISLSSTVYGRHAHTPKRPDQNVSLNECVWTIHNIRTSRKG